MFKYLIISFTIFCLIGDLIILITIKNEIKNCDSDLRDITFELKKTTINIVALAIVLFFFILLLVK